MILLQLMCNCFIFKGSYQLFYHLIAPIRRPSPCCQPRHTRLLEGDPSQLLCRTARLCMSACACALSHKTLPAHALSQRVCRPTQRNKSHNPSSETNLKHTRQYALASLKCPLSDSKMCILVLQSVNDTCALSHTHILAHTRTHTNIHALQEDLCK